MMIVGCLIESGGIQNPEGVAVTDSQNFKQINAKKMTLLELTLNYFSKLRFQVWDSASKVSTDIP
jgi:hypothetical protein